MATATEKSESELIIPDRFLSANSDSDDDFIFVVEGTELHVSKEMLASHSEPLSAMVYNEGFRTAREGTEDLKGKKLSDVVALLCWMWEESSVSEAIYEPFGKGTMNIYGRAKRIYWALQKCKSIAIITIDDIVGLHALAHEWLILPLQQDCTQLYRSYISMDFESKSVAVTALKAVEVFGLGRNVISVSSFADRLFKASVSIEDVLCVDPVFGNHLLKFFLYKELSSKDEALNALDALKRLWEWESLSGSELDVYLDNIIKAGVNIDDIDNIDALNVSRDLKTMLLKRMVCRFAKHQNALDVSSDFETMLLKELVKGLVKHQNKICQCFYCGEAKTFLCSGGREHSADGHDHVSCPPVCTCPGAKAQ